MAVHSQHIKAAAWFTAREMSASDLREKPRCGGQQTPLLASIHAGRRAAMAAMTALADFHEDQFLAVAHDEVDFSGAALQVARQQYQPGRLQVCQGAVFRAVAALAGGAAVPGMAWRLVWRRGRRGVRDGLKACSVLPRQPPLAVAPRTALGFLQLLPERGIRGIAENSILAG